MVALNVKSVVVSTAADTATGMLKIMLALDDPAVSTIYMSKETARQLAYDMLLNTLDSQPDCLHCAIAALIADRLEPTLIVGQLMQVASEVIASIDNRAWQEREIVKAMIALNQWVEEANQTPREAT